MKKLSLLLVSMLSFQSVLSINIENIIVATLLPTIWALSGLTTVLYYKEAKRSQEIIDINKNAIENLDDLSEDTLNEAKNEINSIILEHSISRDRNKDAALYSASLFLTPLFDASFFFFNKLNL